MKRSEIYALGDKNLLISNRRRAKSFFKDREDRKSKRLSDVSMFSLSKRRRKMNKQSFPEWEKSNIIRDYKSENEKFDFHPMDISFEHNDGKDQKKKNTRMKDTSIMTDDLIKTMKMKSIIKRIKK